MSSLGDQRKNTLCIKRWFNLNLRIWIGHSVVCRYFCSWYIHDKFIMDHQNWALEKTCWLQKIIFIWMASWIDKSVTFGVVFLKKNQYVHKNASFCVHYELEESLVRTFFGDEVGSTVNCQSCTLSEGAERIYSTKPTLMTYGTNRMEPRVTQHVKQSPNQISWLCPLPKQSHTYEKALWKRSMNGAMSEGSLRTFGVSW